MKIVVCPSDDEAVGNARLRWPAEACAAQGADVTVLEPHDRNTFLNAMQVRRHVVAVSTPPCDVFVIQRPTARELAESIPFLRRQGTTVVVDVDDGLADIHPSNPAFIGLHPKRDPHNNWHWTDHACRAATLVTASTPALAAKYGAHGRVRVLRNCVPDHYLDVTPVDKLDGFGWAGALHSHPDDLQMLGPTAAKLVRSGHAFTLIGPDPSGVRRVLGLGEDPPGPGRVGFAAWPAQVARLSVGIAPLAPTRFNEAKSNFKILEYLGLGVAFVASPSSEYMRLGHLGAIAARPKEWFRELGLLLNNANLRQERADAGREAARGMTYAVRAGEWLQAWTDASALQRGTVAV